METKLNHYTVFNLPQNYTHEQLENSYSNKRNEILGYNWSNIDKEVYLEQLSRYYNSAKSELRRRYLEEERRYRYGDYHTNQPVYQHGYLYGGYGNPFDYDPFRILHNFQRSIDNFFNYDNIEPTHRQISQFQQVERRLDDGSYLVQSKKLKNVNGTENTVDESYIRHPDGRTEYVDSDRVKALLDNTKRHQAIQY
jgi:hypothetical protein